MLRRDFRPLFPLILVAGVALGCEAREPAAGAAASDQEPAPVDQADTDDPCPVPYLARVDALIEPEESHFAALYKITAGGENAEAYWSFDGDRLVLQRKEQREDGFCDRIYVTKPGEPGLELVSDGRGVTTCAYFLPGDTSVLYASTTLQHTTCPGMPIAPEGVARGYMWALHPEFDVFSRDLVTGERLQLTDEVGYDAEATVSPLGDRMVFTSTRSGDVELWTANIDGSDPFQVTDAFGYDGGAFYSHAADRLVFRTTEFSSDAEVRAAEEAEYRRLLDANLVKPSRMEIYVCNTDGTGRQKITELGGANFAPYFTPDDSHILFSSNHENPNARGPLFDLFMVPSTGGPHGPDAVEKVTTYEGFDSFPMFSPDGKWLAFSSNRGNEAEGVTNVFVARWRD